MIKKKFIMVSLMTVIASNMLSTASPNERTVERKPVFVRQQGGYDTYRIPAIVVTRKGTLLAFCEGRKSGQGDSGNIDLVLKRSVDGGKNWTPMIAIVDDGGHTCGNPAPVVDRKTGTIWLPFTKNRGDIHEKQILKGQGTRDIWVTKSDDDGLTWSKPVEITASVRKPGWRWYATGPCHSIQLRNGKMVIPCDHSLDPDFSNWYSHVFFSDNGGKTWKLGGSAGGYTNESTIVELMDGSLYLNMRSYKGTHRRMVAYSRDEGMTWTEPKDDPFLIEPRCQASVIRYTGTDDYKKNRILFSNPASIKRENMTVRLSYDETKTWGVSKTFDPGPSAYSDLVILPDGTIGCLYERGEKSAYETISFARFTLDWLTDGEDTLSPRRKK